MMHQQCQTNSPLCSKRCCVTGFGHSKHHSVVAEQEKKMQYFYSKKQKSELGPSNICYCELGLEEIRNVHHRVLRGK